MPPEKQKKSKHSSESLSEEVDTTKANERFHQSIFSWAARQQSITQFGGEREKPLLRLDFLRPTVATAAHDPGQQLIRIHSLTTEEIKGIIISMWLRVATATTKHEKQKPTTCTYNDRWTKLIIEKTTFDKPHDLRYRDPKEDGSTWELLHVLVGMDQYWFVVGYLKVSRRVPSHGTILTFFSQRTASWERYDVRWWNRLSASHVSEGSAFFFVESLDVSHKYRYYD